MAPLGRVTYCKYVVGPRPSARDRSAGDSSPVTPRAVGSGDARGRPHPVETVAQAAAHPARCRTSASPLCAAILPKVDTTRAPQVRRVGDPPHAALPPAPHLGTGAALTSVLTTRGPADHASAGPLVVPRGATSSRSGLPASSWRRSTPPSARGRRRGRWVGAAVGILRHSRRRRLPAAAAPTARHLRPARLRRQAGRGLGLGCSGRIAAGRKTHGRRREHGRRRCRRRCRR